MKLHFNTYGDGFPLLILHGFLGTADNWHTLAQRWGNSRRVIVPDLRNHGRSPHSDYHSIQLMADDVLELMDSLNINLIDIIGHSMGGKVAMKIALRFPDKINHLVVADIAPRQYKPGHDDVFAALFAAGIDTAQSRKEVEENMLPHVPDFGVRQFLLKNLWRNAEGKFAWKMNLPVLFNHYNEVIESVTSDVPFNGKTLFIKGELSNYIRDQDMPEIMRLFPLATLSTIKNAGHWVHAEQAEAFYSCTEEFLAT